MSKSAILKFSGLASQFVLLLVLAELMSLEDFGRLMVGFSLIKVIGYSVGTGFGNFYQFMTAKGLYDLMYLRIILLYTVIISIVFVGGLCIFFVFADGSLGVSGYGRWVILLSPGIITTAFAAVYVCVLEMKGDVAEIVFVSDFSPAIFRLASGLICFFNSNIEIILCFSFVVAPLVGVKINFFRSIFSGGGSFFRDLGLNRKCVGLVSVGRLFLATLGGQQLQGIDTIMAGLILDVRSAGMYALAVRFGALATFFSSLVARKVPAVVIKVKNDDNNVWGIVKFELEKIRFNATIVCLGTIFLIMAFVFVYQKIKPDISNLLPVVAAICLGAFVRQPFIGNDVIDRLRGNDARVLAVVLSSLLGLCVFSYILANFFGAIGIGLGYMVSGILINVFYAFIVGKGPVPGFSLKSIGVVLLGGFFIAMPIFCGN